MPRLRAAPILAALLVVVVAVQAADASREPALEGPPEPRAFELAGWRALALLGPAGLQDGVSYLSFSGDFGFDDRLPPDPVLGRRVELEAPLLSSFSLSAVNLEAPLPGVSGSEDARARDEAIVGLLRRLGFDLVSLANNHIWDRGVEGVDHTRRTLEGAGLATLGLRAEPVYWWDADGQRVAVYNAANYFDQPAPDDRVLTLRPEDLALLRERTAEADVRIAFVHLASISSYPSPVERRFVADLIEAGADLVVCTGAHFVKGYFRTDGVPVFHGVGNHLFQWTGPNMESVGMTVVVGLRDNQIVQLFVVPFHHTVQDGLEPRVGPLTEAELAGFSRTLVERSDPDPDAYFRDPRSMDAIRHSFKWKALRHLKWRHVPYAARIVFSAHPFLAGSLMVAGAGLLVFGAVRVVRRGGRGGSR